jgi:hypothetical protein
MEHASKANQILPDAILRRERSTQGDDLLKGNQRAAQNKVFQVSHSKLP